MKTMNLIFAIIITSLFGACDAPLPLPPEPPIVEQDTIFDLIWATRMDFEKEIVGTDNTQHYKDWVLVGGDIGDPPTIMAFDKQSGDKEWEYIHNGNITLEIDYSAVYNNTYIAKCTDGIFAFNLDDKNMIWEFDFDNINFRSSKGLILNAGFLYHGGTKNLNQGDEEKAILKINLSTGEFEEFFNNSFGMSPLVFWNDSNSQNELFIVNEYPLAGQAPETTTQNLMAIDVDTKQVLWKVTDFTESFASNGIHPPIIHNNTVITGGDWSIYAFDVLTGEQLWRYEFDYPWAIWNKTNHLIQDGRLYVNNGQEDVTCINPENGELIWNNPQGGANCTDNMVYYEKEDLLVFTSWGYGSVMVLDALTGETIHREHRYDDSSYNNDVVYDEVRDMFFTSTYKHAIGFKVHKPE